MPSPDKKLKELNERINKFVIIEMNAGQYLLEIERIIGDSDRVLNYGRMNGELITPDEITHFIKGVNND